MTTGAIVIVGGSRGIGRAAARRLSLKGHSVVPTATTEVAATSVATGIAEETGHPVTGLQLDVLDPASIHRFVDKLPHPARSVIVGAARWPEGRERQMTDAGLERTFAVNVLDSLPAHAGDDAASDRIGRHLGARFGSHSSVRACTCMGASRWSPSSTGAAR